MAVKIKILSDKNWFAVRTKLTVKNLEDSSETLNIEGYRLFWTKTGFLDDTESVTEINGAQLAKRIKESVRRGDKKDLTVTLYWIQPKDKPYKMLGVPWGYRKDNYKINGTLNLSIKTEDDENDVKAKKLLQLPIWESVQYDGVNYEYMSEYFIDNLGNQNGLSIWIREQVLPQIMDLVDNSWDSIKRKTRDRLSLVLKNGVNQLSIDLPGANIDKIDCIDCIADE